ncbi:MAG TPA: ABC transporter permease [Actinomycetales bacterium]|nr:ABC transporter permease [Actinomycetales bacterium]
MVAPSPALIVVLVALLALAVAGVSAAGLPLRQAMVTASVRAAVQLAVVSALLVVVFGSVAWTFLYVTAMFVVAAWTSARRVRARTPVWTAAPIAAGTVPVVGVVLASGAVPWKPASILPIAGIVLGGAMTSTSLAAQRMFDELSRRQGEYEAALSLGFVPRDAVLEIARQSSGLALVPALDQTRTVGLVTLPGAFVGVLLGGGSPAAAGAAQVLVLVGLLAAESVAVLVVGELVARRLLTTRELASRLPD